MKTFLRAIVLALCACLMAASARAQFPSTQTNVSFAGNGNHFLSGATITFDSGSVMLFKSNSATTNQLLFVSDTSGTVKPLTLGSNLSITGSTLNGTAFDPNAVQTLTNKTINGANNTLTIRAAQDITGVLPVANGGTNLTAGTSGGIPYYSSSSTMAASAAFSTSQILIGGGAGSPPATLGALGSNVTVLHGNATGPPAFSSVDLAADVTGTLPFAHGGTGLASGTSGGVVYFSSSSALASSSTLSANYIVIGGGAGTAPSIVATTGTTTTVLHGNASGPPTFGATSLTADVSGTLPVANGGTGAVTLTANNIVIGNTTGAVTFLAPGTSGNVVTSNGTAWTSAAATSAGNVTGPGSSVANDIVTWNGTAGTSIKDASGFTASSGTLTSTSAGMTLATSSNGNITLSPNGTGVIIPTKNIDYKAFLQPQELLLYNSSNSVYGFGIDGSLGAMRMFAASTFLTFGQVSSSDGTTWTEDARLNTSTGHWMLLQTTDNGADTAQVTGGINDKGLLTLEPNSATSAGRVTSSAILIKTVASIADNTATSVLTVTIPNAAHSGLVHVYLAGSLGAGGAIGANEATAIAVYNFAVARTSGVNAVASASGVYGNATASVAGAATITMTAVASSISGAVGASNSFTVNVTIAHGSGSSTNHTCLVKAEVENANASGITIN